MSATPAGRVSAQGRAETGSAMVEFVGLGVLLMVVLVQLVLLIGRLQAAAYAVDTAARSAARVFTAAPDESEAARRALTAVRVSLRDQGFALPGTGASGGGDVVSVECSAQPCLTPRAAVTVRVRLEVEGIEVGASHVALVDEFREAP